MARLAFAYAKLHRIILPQMISVPTSELNAFFYFYLNINLTHLVPEKYLLSNVAAPL